MYKGQSIQHKVTKEELFIFIDEFRKILVNNRPLFP
jgi:hypothetical protein